MRCGPAEVSGISIHALREEGDRAVFLRLSTEMIISIHALREEGDAATACERVSLVISIHALREEGDAETGFSGAKILYFYPRPPRGGRPRMELEAYGHSKISIHALREEGDHGN